MRALRALSRRGPRRQARRPQALRRHRAAALSGRRIAVPLALATLAATGGAGFATAKPDPPKPPKPKVELLTTSQESALAKRKVKLEVTGKKGAKARVRATLVVDGYPSPFEERLGSDPKRLRGGEARIRLKLDRRDREVLEFGAQACWAAEVRGTVKAAGRSASFAEPLRKPRGC